MLCIFNSSCFKASAMKRDSWLSSSIFKCQYAPQTKVLTAIFSLPHGDFLSIWCSSEFPPREEDGTLEYDAFTAAGWFLDTFAAANQSNAINLEITLIPSNMPQAMYAHQRTSLFVKLIANLHCFVPNICEGESSHAIFVNIHHDRSVGCWMDYVIQCFVLIHRAGKKLVPS